jgi:L-fuconolactonase
MHIDSEVHFWKYDKSNTHPLIRDNKILAQSYLPEQLAQSLHRNGMQGCVAVTAENLEVETRFMSELALTHAEIMGVVGWTDLYQEHAADKIQELHQYASLKGFQTEPETTRQPSGAVMELLSVYQYSLDLSLGAAADIPGLNNWIKTYPEQSFVLRNCGNPDGRSLSFSVWENQIRELARNENLSCKVCGLLTSARSKSWKPADFYPFLEVVFNTFGPGRLLYASDWPFLLVSGIYVQWKSLLEKFTEKFREEDRDLFFGENAMRIYRL